MLHLWIRISTYGEAAYANMPGAIPPTVHREAVSTALLRLKTMDEVDVFGYEYLTPPAPEQILYTVGQLTDWYT